MKNINDGDIGRMAVLLSVTVTDEEEKALKNEIMGKGYMCAVTGIGGDNDEVKRKLNTSVIAACINNGIIDKNPKDVHAVIHATLEAKEGILLSAPSGGHFAGKIAIVRKDDWIAVAIYGRSAMHIMTNHERIGLGIMHI
ncbi:HutP family protein [Thermovenabulum sp.]|uniref:HutP family protein n=1 Tax=Thermovenabulum sp. TaxID=3100335 RepID=UPI003C7B86C2